MTENNSPVEPVLLALIPCDRVITEDNGKKCVIGTFTSFQLPTFPFTVPPWAVYACITNVSGEQSFALNLKHADSQQIVLPVAGRLNAATKADTIEMGIPVSGVTFADEGEHVLELYVAGQLVGARVVNVMRK